MAAFLVLFSNREAVCAAESKLIIQNVIHLFSLSGNVNLIWWAFPIAELVSVAMSTFFLLRINKKVLRHIGEK